MSIFCKPKSSSSLSYIASFSLRLSPFSLLFYCLTLTLCFSNIKISEILIVTTYLKTFSVMFLIPWALRLSFIFHYLQLQVSTSTYIACFEQVRHLIICQIGPLRQRYSHFSFSVISSILSLPCMHLTHKTEVHLFLHSQVGITTIFSSKQ